MHGNTRFVVLVVALALITFAGIGCEKLKARDELNKGVVASRGGNYPAAVDYFETAISLDPNSPVTRRYLAEAYMMQYVPGDASPENLRMAKDAEDEFLAVLKTEPNNPAAISYLAKLYFDEKRLDDAWEQYKKLASIEPSNKTAFYTLGVIAWTKSYTPDMEARASLGMKPDAPGPLKDKKVREALAKKSLPIINDGLQMLAKAEALDPGYDDAMSYTNLLYRLKADVEPTTAEYKKDIVAADSWAAKAMQIKKIKAARAEQATSGGITVGGG